MWDFLIDKEALEVSLHRCFTFTHTSCGETDNGSYGRSTAQAVVSRSLKAKSQFRSMINPYGVLADKMALGQASLSVV
jgi:hypothetical protein